MITEIKIKNRIAQTVKNGIVTTANAENYINFTFDDEWDPDSVTATRTARFTVNDEIVLDIPFNGNVCPLPVFFEPCNVYVGVFWNDFRTSTNARIIYAPSAVSGGGFPDDPPKDVYNRIIELMNGKLNADQLFKAIEDALQQAKESGEFDGTPNAVQFVPQELTKEQQAQARENINAIDADSIPEWAMQPEKPSYTKREIGLGNVDNVEQYSEKNPPPYPVTSVNGKKGSVQLSASDVGADASGTAASAVSEHNASESAHNDIRLLIEGLAARLSGIADSDDTTLDQLSEIVAYIKSNKSLIDSITTNKVNVSDIINNLTSNVSNKPLSAAQGVVLKALIDAIVVPTKVSQLTNDKGYLTSFTESDPTVPSWAKERAKPSYTKSEVGLGNVDNIKQYSKNNPPPYPVTSVNGKTGDVDLDAESVGARANTWTPTYSEVGADKSGAASSAVTAHNTNESAHNDIRLLIEGLTTRLNALANSTDEDLDQMAEIVAYIKSNKSLIDSITTSKVSVADIVNNLTTNTANKPLSAAQGVALKALIDAITVPTKVSQLENDKGYLTQHQSLADYAKKSEIPTKTSQLENDSEFLTSVPSEYVTETELSAKAEPWTCKMKDGSTVTKKVVLA